MSRSCLHRPLTGNNVSYSFINTRINRHITPGNETAVTIVMRGMHEIKLIEYDAPFRLTLVNDPPLSLSFFFSKIPKFSQS